MLAQDRASVGAIDTKTGVSVEMPMRCEVDNAALLPLGVRIASMQTRHWIAESAMVKLVLIRN